MIKGIFFDAAGILYTRERPTEEYALSLLKDGGFSREISPERQKKQIALRSQASQGRISYDVYWDQFLLMRGVLDPQQRKAFTDQFIDYSNDVHPIPGGREALAGLKQRGFLLGIITDTMYPIEWKMHRLEKAGIAEFIDVVTCSTDLGAYKPDPTVYANALQQAHLKPGESVFVGHLSIELQGAHKAGMVTIAINHDPKAKADYFCSSLLDLLTLPILVRTNSESKANDESQY
jgi:HAD superfamily hydrolase (TIGR01509 family)